MVYFWGGFVNFGSLVKNGFVRVLLFIVILNLVLFGLLWRLDVFVNVDFYSSGLRFSLDWAQDYWHNRGILWGVQIGCTVLAALSILPHHLRNQKPGKFTRVLCFFLPVIAGIYQVVSIVFLIRVNNIVQNRLGNFGLILNFNWDMLYNPVSATTLALMVTVLFSLAIPVFGGLGLIKNIK